jgi:hypothetical protein
VGRNDQNFDYRTKSMALNGEYVRRGSVEAEQPCSRTKQPIDKSTTARRE